MSATDPHTPTTPRGDTTAGGEAEEGSPSAGRTPGSGANAITRAGLPNADPDGYDYQRSDLAGIDIADAPDTESAGDP